MIETVETERLLLRAFQHGDASALEAVFCDPEVMRFSLGVKEPRWIREVFLKETIETNYGLWGFGPWAVERKADGALLGYCGWFREREDCQADEAELGYRLATTYWGQGYGKEAALAACDWAGGQGLRRLVAVIDPGNQASVALAKALGFVFESNYFPPEYDHPDHIYVLKT